MLVSGANMTGIAKRLGKVGYIIRRYDTSDERITLLEITPKGRQAIKNISTEKDELIETYLNGFAEDKKTKILEDIKRIFNKGNAFTRRG
jgi:MarR family 2-MHQ and catechol resistance regulon transcriptional repressor